MNERRHDAPRFTLVELLVVAVLLGVFVAVAVYAVA